MSMISLQQELLPANQGMNFNVVTLWGGTLYADNPFTPLKVFGFGNVIGDTNDSTINLTGQPFPGATPANSVVINGNNNQITGGFGSNYLSVSGGGNFVNGGYGISDVVDLSGYNSYAAGGWGTNIGYAYGNGLTLDFSQGGYNQANLNGYNLNYYGGAGPDQVVANVNNSFINLGGDQYYPGGENTLGLVGNGNTVVDEGHGIISLAGIGNDVLGIGSSAIVALSEGSSANFDAEAGSHLVAVEMGENVNVTGTVGLGSDLTIIGPDGFRQAISNLLALQNQKGGPILGGGKGLAISPDQPTPFSMTGQLHNVGAHATIVAALPH